MKGFKAEELLKNCMGHMGQSHMGGSGSSIVLTMIASNGFLKK